MCLSHLIPATPNRNKTKHFSDNQTNFCFGCVFFQIDALFLHIECESLAYFGLLWLLDLIFKHMVPVVKVKMCGGVPELSNIRYGYLLYFFPK